MGSEPFTVTADDEIIVDNKFALTGFSATGIDSFLTTPLVLIQVIDVPTNTPLMELNKLTLGGVASWNVADTVISGSFAVSLKDLEGRNVKIRTSLIGQREQLREPAWTGILYGTETGGKTKLSDAKNTGIADNLPTHYALEQNYPNPFNPVTVIKYQLPVNSFVTLKVYDILGREVVTIANEEQAAGYKSVEFNASKFPSGVYIYKLTAGSFVETKKMVLLK